MDMELEATIMQIHAWATFQSPGEQASEHADMYTDFEHLSCNALALACGNFFRCDTCVLLPLPMTCVGVFAAAVQAPKRETNTIMRRNSDLGLWGYSETI